MEAVELGTLAASANWVDWLLLAVLVASVLIGLVRGLVFELLSLAGWVVAWFAAQWATPIVARWLPASPAGSTLDLAAAFGLAFVAVLIAWSLLAKLIRLLLHATPLSLPDRLLGALFGVLRGGVLLLALATVVAFTPASQSQDWRASQGARWLGATLAGLKPLLPADVARHLPT